jgi:hypothetical protein
MVEKPSDINGKANNPGLPHPHIRCMGHMGPENFATGRIWKNKDDKAEAQNNSSTQHMEVEKRLTKSHARGGITYLEGHFRRMRVLR